MSPYFANMSQCEHFVRTTHISLQDKTDEEWVEVL